MNFRIADKSDFSQLAALRWDFRMEEGDEQPVVSRERFIEECVKFFERVASSDYHVYWIAENSEEIISQIFVHKIDMIPRPCKINDQFAYITNNYTIPAYRNRGIGTELMRRVIDWAAREDLELLIVYPSERAVSFYERARFKAENEVMELRLREYYSEEWVK